MPKLDAHLVDASTLMPAQSWIPAYGADAHWNKWMITQCLKMPDLDD